MSPAKRRRSHLFGLVIPALVPLLLASQSVTCENRFVDDDGSVFEADIERLAAAGVTRGCNPPVNDRFCPDDNVTRGQMAAFLVRAMGYQAGAGSDRFVDDDGSVFEADIERLAAAGVTRGCNPPVNDRFCPDDNVTRGQMAAFLVRALDLPPPPRIKDPRTVQLRIGEVERLAARRGVSIAAVSEGCRLGAVSDASPRATVTAPAGPIRFVYVSPEGVSSNVVWSQTPTVGPDGATVVVSQPWRRSPDSGFSSVSVAWQFEGDRPTYRAQLDATSGLDVVSPIWWSVRADGTIGRFPDTNPAYFDDVHARGKRAWPAVASSDPDAIHSLVSDPVRRNAAARQISEAARLQGADGVNIDIEGFRNEDASAFTAFVAALAEEIHAWGGVVSYDVIARTDTFGRLSHWATAPQRRQLAALVDYTVLMAYDQHSRHTPPGPVAAPAWVEDVLVYQLRYSDPHEILLGVPFYTRVWDPDALDQPQAVDMATLVSLAGSGSPTFDPRFGLVRVELDDGRFLWREGPAVIANRLDLVDDYRLGGWAAWRLGQDSPAVWNAIGG